MLERGIGKYNWKSYFNIAKYFEKVENDYRKAEKTFRQGIKTIPAENNSYDQLQLMFWEFKKRQADRTRKVKNELIFIKKDKNAVQIPRKEYQKLRQEHDKLLPSKRRTFTKDQVYYDNVPIFVDEQFRNDVIPISVQNVENYYDMVEQIDKYRIADWRNESIERGNIFIKEIK